MVWENCFHRSLFALNVNNFQCTHQRETTVISSNYHTLPPFTKVELLLKERICSQMEQKSIFFPLRAVPSGTGKTVSTLGYLP